MSHNRGTSIEPWSEVHRGGAIEVVGSVFDEYGFTWDEEAYHADLYDVPGYYLGRGWPFFVATNNTHVVGTAALCTFDLIPGEPGTARELDGYIRVAGTDCSLARLYVRPEARGQGVGTRLLEAVLATARKRRRKALEIWSDKRFEDAHRLYRRFGAIDAGERICDDPDVSPEWGLLIYLGSRAKLRAVS